MMNSVTELTYSGICLAVFAEQMCLPVPAVLLMMTAGALAAHGKGHLHLPVVLAVCVFGCLAADGFWFWMGRRWGSRVIRLVCSFTSDPRASRERARRIFSSWGLRLLLVAKFVPGLDGVSPPLAGTEGLPVSGFLLYDAAGSLLWSTVYVLLGYIFANQVDAVMHAMERFGSVLLLGIGVPLLTYIVWRAAQIARVIRHLRLHRISPALLQTRLDDGERLAIFDLLDYEARTGVIPGIPGALRVNPGRLKNVPRLHFPDGVGVVLYCSSRNELVSARVAQSLERRGMTNVWVLEGGLEAWVEDGRPVTEHLGTRQEIAAILGVQFPPDVMQGS